MVALEITAFCKVECDEIGFEVIYGSTIRRLLALRGGREELRDLLLKSPDHSVERGTVEDR